MNKQKGYFDFNFIPLLIFAGIGVISCLYIVIKGVEWVVNHVRIV